MNTPIFIKTDPKMPWPKDKFFYLVTSDGFFKCRNTPFFESCVPCKGGPSELAGQHSFVRLSYPKLPQALVEKAVGFFRLVAIKQNSEAAAIWLWNQKTKEVELIIPDQKVINSAPSSYNPKGYPMDVKYEIPTLAPHQIYLGDIHCHVDGGAYASGMDESDEKHRAGIHIVVGKIDKKKPEFYCDAVVDGQRFEVKDMELVWEGFDEVDTDSVPPEWLDKVKLETKTWKSDYSYGSGYQQNEFKEREYKEEEFDDSDRRIMKQVLYEFLDKYHMNNPPLMTTVRQELFHRTKHVPYLGCEQKAKKFLAEWDKLKGLHEETVTSKA